MNYILLAIATNAYLGTYTSSQACENAIYERMLAQMAPPTTLAEMSLFKPQLELLARLATSIQTEYQCVPQGVDKGKT